MRDSIRKNARRWENARRGRRGREGDFGRTRDVGDYGRTRDVGDLGERETEEERERAEERETTEERETWETGAGDGGRRAEDGWAEGRMAGWPEDGGNGKTAKRRNPEERETSGELWIGKEPSFQSIGQKDGGRKIVGHWASGDFSDPIFLTSLPWLGLWC